MALKALTLGGTFDVLPECELKKVEELAAVSKEKADEYKQHHAAALIARLPTVEEQARIDSLGQPRWGNDGTFYIPSFGELVLYVNLTLLVGWRNIVDSDGAPIAFTGRRDDTGQIVGATVGDLAKLLPEIRQDFCSTVRSRLKVSSRDFLFCG